MEAEKFWFSLFSEFSLSVVWDSTVGDTSAIEASRIFCIAVLLRPISTSSWEMAPCELGSISFAKSDNFQISAPCSREVTEGNGSTHVSLDARQSPNPEAWAKKYILFVN